MKRTKILIGNLSTDATEEKIREFFAGTAGEVFSVTIPLEVKTGKNRGYAFIEMSSDTVEQAIMDLNGRAIGGRAASMSLVEKIEVTRKWYQFGT